MPIYKGSTLLSGTAYSGSNTIDAMWYGTENIFGEVFTPTGPLVYVDQATGTGTTRVISSGHKAASIFNFPGEFYGSGSYGYSYTFYYPDGSDYPFYDRFWTDIRTSDFNTYQPAKLSAVSATDYTMGGDTITNGSGHTNIVNVSFRHDGEFTQVGGDLSSTCYNVPGYGVHHMVYTGNGTASQTIKHNCGVIPDLVLCRGLASSRNFLVQGPLLDTLTGSSNSISDFYGDGFGINSNFYFDVSSFTNQYIQTGSSVWQDTNTNNSDYFVWMFCDTPGYVKTGTLSAAGGSTQTINCGFTPSWIYVREINDETDPNDTGLHYVSVKNNGALGQAYTFQWSEHSSQGGSGLSHFTITSTGFTVADGGPGNGRGDNSKMLYVAVNGAT